MRKAATINIDMDKPCSKCGKGGATGGGLCMSCVAAKVTGQLASDRTVELDARHDLSAFVGDEESGPIAGVFVDVQKRLVMATNGHCAIVVPLPDVPADQLALFTNALDVGPAESCIVMADALKDAVALAGAVRLGMADGKVALYKVNDGGEFISSGAAVLGKTEFPKLDQVMVDAPTAFKVGPKSLAALAKYAEKFKAEYIEFCVYKSDPEATPAIQARMIIFGGLKVKACIGQMK
jgi:hypothetical protein